MSHPQQQPDASQAPAGASAAEKRGGWWRWLRETAIVVVVTMLVMAIVRMFVFQMFIIPSGSMENTLRIDDRIVVPKVLHYHRGDVVVFADPGGWLGQTPAPRAPVRAALEFVGILPDTSENYLVKRVIGIPGDHVKCCTATGQMTVNGVALDEGSYLFSAGGKTVAPSDFPFEVVVPAGRVFVMGDHRNDSDDSRCHLRTLGVGAFVPEDRIKGVATMTVLPFSHARTFTTPATFAAVPAPTSVPAEPVIHADSVPCF